MRHVNLKTMYTLNSTDLDNGGQFINKPNANFAEDVKPQSSHTNAECLTRFIGEMNKKAALLGMENTTFYDPVGIQPIESVPGSDLSSFPDVFVSANANTITAIDALRMIIYASGVQPIKDAWGIRQFSLNWHNGTTSKTATIMSSVYNSPVYQSSIDSILESYDILGGKTGTWGFSPYNAYNLFIIARSKSTGKVYAVTNMSTSTANSASDNRFIDSKKALDKVDAGGATPSFNKGGCCVCELPNINPSWLNRADIDLLYSYGSTTSFHPASTTKVMTAILLCENVLDLNQSVTVQESDRMPLSASGYNFEAGDVLTLQDLLQCMVTESSCTSAMVISRVVGGILLDRDANVR